MKKMKLSFPTFLKPYKNCLFLEAFLNYSCPSENDIVLEVAPLNYTLGRILIDVINVIAKVVK